MLLGRFNGQGLEGRHQLLVRETPPDEHSPGEFVKLVLHDGRVFGALLIGETGMEETLENLILNGACVRACACVREFGSFAGCRH